MKKPVLLILFFILIISVLGIARLAVSNRLSTSGIELERLQAGIANYKKENTLLEEKVLTASSLTGLSKKAKEAGFVENRTQISFSKNLPLAQNLIQ